MEYDYDTGLLDAPGAGSPVLNETITLPRTYLLGQSADAELIVYSMDGDGDLTKLERDVDWSEVGSGVTSNQITVGLGSPIVIGDKIRVVMKDYVYFTREDENSEWEVIETTDSLCPDPKAKGGKKNLG